MVTITVFLLPQGGVGFVTTEADLSGRHLERLPTALFSSLHITSINLSHNLLSSTTSFPKRRCIGQARKRKDRIRCTVSPECLEASGAQAKLRPLVIGQDTHHLSDTTDGRNIKEGRLNVGSGVTTDQIERDSLRDAQGKLFIDASLKKKGSVSDLENKLRQRRIVNEGCSKTGAATAEQTLTRHSKSPSLDSSCCVENENTEINVSTECLSQSLTLPLTEPRPPSPDLPKPFSSSGGIISTGSADSRWTGVGSKREEGSRSSYEGSTSSCADESNSESEAEEAAVEGGEVWAASTRSLGTLHQLRYFQQLQVRHCPSLLYSLGAGQVSACLYLLATLCTTCSYSMKYLK